MPADVTKEPKYKYEIYVTYYQPKKLKNGGADIVQLRKRKIMLGHRNKYFAIDSMDGDCKKAQQKMKSFYTKGNALIVDSPQFSVDTYKKCGSFL